MEKRHESISIRIPQVTPLPEPPLTPPQAHRQTPQIPQQLTGRQQTLPTNQTCPTNIKTSLLYYQTNTINNLTTTIYTETTTTTIATPPITSMDMDNF